MPLIDYDIWGNKIDKVKIAISRIKSFDPLQFSDNPYYTAYSGGKDSDVIRILCHLASVKHDLVHNHTTVDAPETVHYIRSIPNIQIEMPEISMWKLIVKKGMPPTRLARYCCSELKEKGGKNRIVITGVRWAESNKRKTNRGLAEVLPSNSKNNLILNQDNDESRRLFENCTMKGKRIINPIIDWTDDEVWEFLNYYGCESNPLYQCGYKRVGCVGCPMSTRQKQEFLHYPKYKQNYINAFDKMILSNISKGSTIDENWSSGENVFKWWVDNVKKQLELEGQFEIGGV